MLQNILWGFICIIIGLNLSSTVANQIASAKNNSNFSSTDTSLLGLVTTFFVISILAVGVALVSVSFAQAGLA